jgi:hypothetical protein
MRAVRPSTHLAVNDSKGNDVRHGSSTNAVESFFPRSERSIDRTHHHVRSPHPHRCRGEFGALTVLYALRSMDWASRVDDLGRTTFKVGPTSLLAVVAPRRLLFR